MKTLKEPQEPFCPPFPLPLSPLSRRRRVAFCAFNQQLFLSFFLSSRDLMMSVFCPDSLSLSLAKQPKREPETTFFGSKSTKSASFLHQNGGKKDLSCFFIFVVSTDPTAGIRIKKIRKNQAIFKSKLNELHHNNPARADEL